MYWYWWAWFAIVVFLVLLPLSYGWGYRGWGPPYPRSYTSRWGARPVGRASDPPPRGRDRLQGEQTTVVLVEERPVEPEPSGWGILADLIWLAVITAIIWAIVAGIS